MCKYFIQGFGLGIILCFTISCKKSTPIPAPFQANVNATSFGAGNDTYNAIVKENNGVFTISGSYTNGSGPSYSGQTITIVAAITGTGNYNLNNSPNNYATFSGGDAHVQAYFNTDSVHTGTLTVTDYNTSTSTISGNFNFTAYSANGLNNMTGPETAAVSGSFYQLKW